MPIYSINTVFIFRVDEGIDEGIIRVGLEIVSANEAIAS